ncbi:MAG: phospholipase C, phosphocholine-specific [Pseudomonadota bacterium]
MVQIDRRRVLAAGGAGLLAASPIARAMAIDADVRKGTLADIEHIVILMQENRGFDHYFGSAAGVRGFGDRFPIPSAAGHDRQTVWTQFGAPDRPAGIAPFHLDTIEAFPLMRAEGTPHSWPDAQAAWDEGRMSWWPKAKTPGSMGYYRAADLPFQYALADAFTLCDAYHCSVQTGTNTNRLFLWSGTNDPLGKAGGPSIANSHDQLVRNGGAPDGYRWTSYVERLQAAGIDWRIYEDMADNFTDNPLVGFRRFRDADAAGPGGADHQLIARGLSTQKLDRLRHDVMNGTLPQISYIIADAAGSEHPSASSPAQGADYTARVLDALTANPKVWSRTALLVMFDENDGFFDHVPPPAPPSRDPAAPDGLAGGSTVSTEGEYHLVRSATDAPFERPEFMGRPYGLGPRVPMYVISPWSRGGWINSETFDHTSVIRFLELRFGVQEPNISPWRRSVCGDLTSAFDFRHPNDARNWPALPATAAQAARAAALPKRTVPVPPGQPDMPVQATGPRRSRALPYALDVQAHVADDGIRLDFANSGRAGAVFHVYDRLHLQRAPRRYTVGASARLSGLWQGSRDDAYDLWVLGPNGFHRHFIGTLNSGALRVSLRSEPVRRAIALTFDNPGAAMRRIDIRPMAYAKALDARTITLRPGQSVTELWRVAATSGWYDLAVEIDAEKAHFQRFAGRLETGRDSISDPAMGGAAIRALPR